MFTSSLWYAFPGEKVLHLRTRRFLMARKKKTNFLVSAHRTLRKKSVVAAVYIVLRCW